MYFALGLLTAGLLVLTVAPAIWRRAIRLTRARVEATVPMSLAEIQADKDQLRAEYAVATRRLELNAESAERRAAERTIEVNLLRAEMTHMTGDLSAKTVAISSLEQRLKDLSAAFAGAEERIGATRTELAERDLRLQERHQLLTATDRARATAEERIDEQKVELVARDTIIGNLRDQLEAARSAEATVARARAELAAALAETQGRLTAERAKAEGLEARTMAFEVERTDRLALLERRASEIRALETAIAAESAAREALAREVARLEGDQGPRREEYDRRAAEIAALKAEFAAAVAERNRLSERLRQIGEGGDNAAPAPQAGMLAAVPPADAIADGDNVRKAIAATEAEKASLVERLGAAEAERAALRAENAELKRLGVIRTGSDRSADAALKAKLDEIAAKILKAAGAGNEGPLAAVPVEDSETAPGENGSGSAHPVENGAAEPSAAPPAETPPTPAIEVSPPAQRLRPGTAGRSLAERIRALQHADSRH